MLGCDPPLTGRAEQRALYASLSLKILHVSDLSGFVPQQDPRQKTIYDLFQKTFADDGDDLDEALCMEAVDACQNPDLGCAGQSAEDSCSESPRKKQRIEDFFCKQ